MKQSNRALSESQSPAVKNNTDKNNYVSRIKKTHFALTTNGASGQSCAILEQIISRSFLSCLLSTPLSLSTMSSQNRPLRVLTYSILLNWVATCEREEGRSHNLHNKPIVNFAPRPFFFSSLPPVLLEKKKVTWERGKPSTHVCIDL